MPDKYLSVVDAGTNSFHLIIVKVLTENNFEIVDRERVVVRLGSKGSHVLKRIEDEELERASNVLKLFKTKADKFNTKLKVVATSAVREAENKDFFINEIFNRTGVQIDVIDGKKEAEYIYFGMRKGLELNDKKTILALDIGGGSTEFIVGNDDKILFSESLKLGAVRQMKQFFPDYILSKGKIIECQEFISNEINQIKDEILKFQPEIFIGSSGTVHSTMSICLSQIKIKIRKPFNNINFTSLQLQSVVNNVLSKKTVEDRKKVKGLEEKRADIIPAGILILNEIFKTFSIKNLTVSSFALREGVILSLINELNSK